MVREKKAFDSENELHGEKASIYILNQKGSEDSKKILEDDKDHMKSSDENAENKIAPSSEVMEYLTSVMRGDGDTQNSDDDGIDTKDRIKAAELLGKRYSLFTNKVQIGAEASINIIDDVPGEYDG